MDKVELEIPFFCRLKFLMRRVIEPQMKLGAVVIADIKLDPKFRDDIPQILRGLQHINTTTALREPIFAILAGVLSERQVDGKTIKADPHHRYHRTHRPHETAEKNALAPMAMKKASPLFNIPG